VKALKCTILVRVTTITAVHVNWKKGTRAFCSGGDQALRSSDGYADFENFGRLNVLDLQVFLIFSYP
jgi:1,4-dihydroxy-2-naphthoyl-CoA synthase